MKKTVKKASIILSVALSTGIILPATLPQAQASDYIGLPPESGYKILSTHYLSKQQVKDMASIMKTLTGNEASGVATLIEFFSKLPIPISYAYTLSANAQYQEEVIKASYLDMRVKVVTKDKPPYTSYSKVVEYIAVP